jgi:hypothetical protein
MLDQLASTSSGTITPQYALIADAIYLPTRTDCIVLCVVGGKQDDKGVERNATTDFMFYTGSSDPLARSSLVIAQPATGRWHQVTLTSCSYCTRTRV